MPPLCTPAFQTKIPVNFLQFDIFHWNSRGKGSFGPTHIKGQIFDQDLSVIQLTSVSSAVTWPSGRRQNWSTLQSRKKKPWFEWQKWRGKIPAVLLQLCFLCQQNSVSTDVCSHLPSRAVALASGIFLVNNLKCRKLTQVLCMITYSVFCLVNKKGLNIVASLQGFSSSDPAVRATERSMPLSKCGGYVLSE